MKNRTRLTVDVPGRLDEILEQLSEETGRSKSELLRLGIDFLGKANTAMLQGMIVGAWRDEEDGRRREREFSLWS